MKSFVVFAAVLAVATATPGLLGYNGLGYAAAPGYYQAAPAIVAPAYTKTQYHAQDELGQSSHGYAHPGQAAAEVRDAFGNVRGSYAYIDPTGKEVRVNYVADAVNGFRVESNALPVGPSAGPAGPALIAPAPVQDTPEVVEARAAHARAFAEAAAAAAVQPERRKKRGLGYAYTTLAGAPALTYAAAPAAYGYGYTAVHAPALTYAAAPAHVAYAAAPVAYAAAPALRAATLTKVVNTPGHAVSYRVD